MLTYVQKTGAILNAGGHLVAGGYAGRGSHKNDPDSDHLVNEGPLPKGFYELEAPVDTPTHGPCVIRLKPDPTNEMHGRAGFLIHGDSIASPGNASNGCIVAGRAVRRYLWEAGDHRMRVIGEKD